MIILLPAPGRWSFFASKAITVYKLHSGKCCWHPLGGRNVYGFDCELDPAGARAIGCTEEDAAALWVSDRGGAVLHNATVAHTAPTAGAGDTVALAAATGRKAALFQNDSADTIYLNLGGAAVVNTGIRLNAGGGAYQIDGVQPFRGAVNFASATLGARLLVTEWT